MKTALAPRLALLGALLIAAPAAGWDRTGHLVVARVAWDQLDAATRAAAVELLLAAPEEADLAHPGFDRPANEKQRRRLFQIAAYWPDIVRDEAFPERRDRFHHGDWHWINHFFEQRDGESVELTGMEPAGLIVERLGTLTAELGDPSLPAGERGIHLAWVLHLGGDIHQPLHATARVTPTEPEGDRGGNLFELGDGENLHSFWDGILRSSTFRWPFQGEDSYVGRIAASIAAEHPPEELGDELHDRDFAAWPRESFEISMAELYPPELERGSPPPRRYERRAEEIARRRVALAGYRLAALLEDALGD